MKLTAAKCPNCNANIEVNENLDKAICQYCGSTILIESAIQKYQMEVKGTIKVDGIQSNKEKIEIVKKYLKIGNEFEAKKILEELLNKNPFDEDALSTIIQINLDKLIKYKNKLENQNITWNIEQLNEFSQQITNCNVSSQIKILQETSDKNYDSIIKEYESLLKNIEENITLKKINIIQKLKTDRKINQAMTILNEILTNNPDNQDALAIIIQIKTESLKNIKEKLMNSNFILDMKYMTTQLETFDNCNAKEQISILKKISNNEYENVIREYEVINNEVQKLITKKGKKVFIIITIFVVSLIILMLYFMLNL